MTLLEIAAAINGRTEKDLRPLADRIVDMADIPSPSSEEKALFQAIENLELVVKQALIVCENSYGYDKFRNLIDRSEIDLLHARLNNTRFRVRFRHDSPNDFKKVPIPEHYRWWVFERDDFTCQSCGSRQYLCVDHIYPESKGGKTILSNLQTLCKSCNSAKGNRYEE